MATSRASDARAAVDLSFEQLYRGHHADVFRAALRELGNVHDAEDVTQAAFVDAYRAVLRGSRPEAPRAWLLAIAQNVRRRRYRTAQRRPREEAMDADFPLSAEIPHELAHALAEALGTLPDDQRRVFVLREIGGLSYDEIAAETGSTVGAVQMQLFRARRALREQLDPPTVARRRGGLLTPLPGWLATLASRVDVSLPAARAAGALGAAVVAVGATVAVNETRADAAPAVDPRPALAGPTAGAIAAERPQARTTAEAKTRATASVASAPRAAAPQRPRAQRARGTQPAPTAVEPPAAAVGARPRPAVVETASRLVERPRLPVRLPVEEAERVLELPGKPPLSTALVPEAVTGAARAAGDGAPPLPAPGALPVTVPPAP